MSEETASTPGASDEALQDNEELLYRQVHPSWIRDGRPSSQSFRPMPKDDRQLSVDRSSLTSAEDAHKHHVDALGLPSAGTWAVSVGECRSQELPVRPDPIPATELPANPSHAYVDFSAVVSQGQIEAKATRLNRMAFTRGRLHPGKTPSDLPPAS